jgi:hypothetical protein
VYSLGEAIEDIDELSETPIPFRLPLFDPFWDAFFDVTPEHRQADTVERGFGGGQLLEDLDAEAGLLDHAADPPYLPFDTVQPGNKRLLLSGIQHTP